MNFVKLFEMQEKLEEHILNRFPDLKHENLLPKKILALQVELGELAQNWRGFKYWSKDQGSKVQVSEFGWGEPYKNPLLEEYADCLHFILSIGIEIEVTTQFNYYPMDSPFNFNLIDTFTSLITDAESLIEPDKEKNFIMIFCRFLSLGEQLGFTQDQIEQAYFAKNAVNHQRQDSGY